MPVALLARVIWFCNVLNAPPRYPSAPALLETLYRKRLRASWVATGGVAKGLTKKGAGTH